MELTYRSPEINLIMGALAKAQGSYKPLIANEDSPGGKFANLQAILLATRESLSSNNLSFYQYIELLDEGSGAGLLKTIIGHESGQWIGSCARVIAAKTDRQTGNTTEFHKRQHAAMLLGIAPSKNDPYMFDDNGISQADDVIIEQMRKPVRMNNESREVINNDQYVDLTYELEGYIDIHKGVLNTYGIETLADLPREEYHRALARIRQIKKNYTDHNLGPAAGKK